MERLGFIGMGNMAKAIAKGLLQKEMVAANQLYAYAPNQEKLKQNAREIGFTPVETVRALVEQVDTLVMACKPYQIEGVLAQIQDLLPGKALLSIALSWNYDQYKQFVSEQTRVQFIMPNTPAQVGEGVFLFEQDNSLEEQERMQVMTLFGALGKVVDLPANLMGIGGAITGCGPAFVDVMLEAYADAAVKYGVARELAYELVSQTVLGSAKLQLETGTHPAVLKDAVCSPGGSTIRGVEALEKNGMRAACMSAIEAVMNR